MSFTNTDGAIKEKIREKIKEPRRWNVIMHNDDYTPMDFVVDVLIDIFNKDNNEAHNIMMAIHKKGKAIIGTYSKDIAITKKEMTDERAKMEKFPLKTTIKEEE